MTPAVSVRGLRKSYGSVEAVAGVDMTIERGEVFGLLGPNGAGKTTVVEILEGHRARSSGDVQVLGFDPGLRERAFRERIGIVPQEGGLDPVLTVREVVDLYGAAYPRPRPADDVIELVGLADKRGARVETLSGGRKRRLDLAVALAGDPELLFLDEPTTGFDPSARRRAWSLVDGLRSLEKTIVLTTHYMEEAQRLADRIAVIDHGKLIAEGTPSSLKARVGGDRLEIKLENGSVEAALAAVAPISDGQPSAEDGLVRVPLRDRRGAIADAVRRLDEARVGIDDIALRTPTLDDVFLTLTGHAAETQEEEE